MALITNSIADEYRKAYDGYDSQAVGLGVINPNIYATPAYQKKKIHTLLIGGVSKIRYAGYEHDSEPTIIPIRFIMEWNAILAVNLRYVPENYRKAIMKHILDSNAARIRSNQPLMIDWHALKRSVPQIAQITRLYKRVGIHVSETVPLVEWPNIIKEKSPWETHYKVLLEQSNNAKRKRKG